MSNIRKAEFKDIDIIADFQVYMAKETEGLTLKKETIIDGIKAVFEDPGRGQYYVYVIDKLVVGCLLTTFEWSEWRNGTVLWIQSVYVAKEYRGQAVFKKLYQYVKEMVMSSESLVGIRLYVEKENTNAQKVYEKIGMNGEHYKLYEWLK